MTKNEVEKNEEGLFKKWLDQTDHIIANWFSPKSTTDPLEREELEQQTTSEVEEMPKAPTSFERNLEVWRQLYDNTSLLLSTALVLRPPTDGE